MRNLDVCVDIWWEVDLTQELSCMGEMYVNGHHIAYKVEEDAGILSSELLDNLSRYKKAILDSGDLV